MNDISLNSDYFTLFKILKMLSILFRILNTFSVSDHHSIDCYMNTYHTFPKSCGDLGQILQCRVVMKNTIF